MFFGIAVGLILFFFIARVAIFAFILAAIMSIVYAIFRRVKDFITYDRYGRYYIPEYRRERLPYYERNGVEPLFHESYASRRKRIGRIEFIDAM